MRTAAHALRRPRWALGLAFVAAMVASPVQAGLFDDEEARKAILDLRTRLTQTDQRLSEQATAHAAAQAQLNEQIQQLRRSLLDLNAQNEALRAELARLRGTDEEMARSLSEVQRRQTDLVQGVDERIRRIEPQKVTLDGREILVEPDERKAFEEALAAVRGGEFERAVGDLQSFLRRYPASGYADAARYWLGNAQYGRKAYKESIAMFRAFVSAAPDHPRAPEALLATASSQVEMKDSRTARRTLEELIKAYPQSEAAVAARERLAAMR